MYRQKNGKYDFFQPQKIRKIKFFDYSIILLGIYIFIISVPKKITESTISSFFIIVLYVLSRFIAPIIIKKYNISIDNNFIYIDNIELSTIKIPLQHIVRLKTLSEKGFSIELDEKYGNIVYKIDVDEGETKIFLEIYNRIIKENKTKIQKIIADSLI